MIINDFKDGQGLGNQLWNYAVTRIIALRKNYDFLITGREHFKGKEIIDLDYGLPIEKLPEKYDHLQENMVRHPANNIDITPFDEKIWNVNDNTEIEGIMQSMKYIEDYKENLIEWLTIKPNRVNLNYNRDDYCIIHFRGGDYRSAGGTLLTTLYYQRAAEYMKKKNPDMRFVVVSDDVNYALQYFPWAEKGGTARVTGYDKYKASHHIGGPVEIDYAIINSAKNIILSNSTFGFWAAYTNKFEPDVIYPKYWFAHNYSDGYWSTADMLIKEWTYLDKEGVFNAS